VAYTSSQPRLARFLSGRSAKTGKTAKAAEASMKRVQFSSSYVPYLFLAPQLAVIFIFFYWPSVQAVQSSFFIEDPFGFGATFVGFANYSDGPRLTDAADKALYAAKRAGRNRVVLARPGSDLNANTTRR